MYIKQSVDASQGNMHFVIELRGRSRHYFVLTCANHWTVLECHIEEASMFLKRLISFNYFIYPYIV